MKGFNPNQLNIFETPPPQMVEQDVQGRTRTDIEKACKSLKEEVLRSITFKDNQWYIEEMRADDWITKDELLNNKEHYWD